MTKKKRATKKKSTTNSIDICREFLLGDVMSAMLSPCKGMQLGWGSITEDMQNELIRRTEIDARLIIERIVEIISAEKYEYIKVSVDHAKVKPPNVLGQISFAMDHNKREPFLDRCGNSAILLLVDSDDYMDDTTAPKAEPDQRPLSSIE